MSGFITPGRRKMLLLIFSHIEDNGIPPRWVDVANELGTSYQYVQKEMKILKRVGYVTWQPYRPETLKVVRLPDRAA